MNSSYKKFPLMLFLIPLFFILVTPTSNASDNEIVDQLKTCARIGEQSTRLSCYEELGKSLIAIEQKESTEAVAEVNEDKDSGTQSASDTLPDSLGGGDFADKAGRVIESNRGRVTSCKKASDRKWFYIFENGQVWKQVDSRKRRHRNCDFMVTVTKDSFGYKMVIDGLDSKIRIDRRR